MPEQQKGLLTKESIKRTIKSKWFLPALGVGGAVVVLLIVMNKRSGGATAKPTDESIVPEDTGMSAPAGSISDGTDTRGLFDELSSSLTTQNQQQAAAIQAALDAQNAAISGTASDLQDQLASAISGLAGQSYVDPYAGMVYTDPGMGAAYTDAGYSDYGVDDTGLDAMPVLEPSVSSPVTPHMTMGQAAGQSQKMQQSGIKPLTSTLRTTTGGKGTPTTRTTTGGKGTPTTPSAAPPKVMPTTKTGQIGARTQGIAAGQTGPKSFGGTPASQAKVMTTGAKPPSSTQQIAQQAAASQQAKAQAAVSQAQSSYHAPAPTQYKPPAPAPTKTYKPPASAPTKVSKPSKPAPTKSKGKK